MVDSRARQGGRLGCADEIVYRAAAAPQSEPGPQHLRESPRQLRWDRRRHHAGSPESDFAAAISGVREAARWRWREARVEDAQVSLGDLS